MAPLARALSRLDPHLEEVWLTSPCVTRNDQRTFVRTRYVRFGTIDRDTYSPLRPGTVNSSFGPPVVVGAAMS